MTLTFQSRRTSLAPIAAALQAATVEYAESRLAFEKVSQELHAARRRNAPERVELANQSDAAVEVMEFSQERVANLMADLQAMGGLSDFYAFVSAHNRDAT